MYRSSTEAFLSELAHVTAYGTRQTVRGSTTLEALNRVVTVTEPLDRCIVVPHRRNDPFAMIAETMWVLAGRNDLEYLSHYLPRAPEFSDDGATWRGAYGPRLRNWGNPPRDQIRAARDLLRTEPNTRRAVMSLFDPARDFDDTGDVPCNNWLHFIQRRGRLHLNVAVRSNDIMWGFSGINTFEWSVLLEAMSYWLGVPPGSMTFFVSSLHLYERHFDRADVILRRAAGGPAPHIPTTSDCSPSFATSFEDLPAVLAEWFSLEERIRAGFEPLGEINRFPDPLLRDFLRMLHLRYLYSQGVSRHALTAALECVEGQGHRRAAAEIMFAETTRPLPGSLGASATFAGEATINDQSDASSTAHGAPLDASRGVRQDPAGQRTGEIRLRSDIVALHRSKNASYGPSWKRRGEVLGILANLARKADRLDALSSGAPVGDESLLDTATDLSVYSLKYVTYLADLDDAVARAVGLSNSPPPYSDGTEAFEQLLRLMPWQTVDRLPADLTRGVVRQFANLEHLIMRGQAPPTRRAHEAQTLAASAYILALSIVQHRADADPATLHFGAV